MHLCRHVAAGRLRQYRNIGPSLRDERRSPSPPDDVPAACNELDDLPITRKAADKAVRKYGNALLREVPDPAWDALPKFNEPQRDIPKDDLHQQMLFLLFVFEYMNGEMWYEVNPVLRTLERFRR